MAKLKNKTMSNEEEQNLLEKKVQDILEGYAIAANTLPQPGEISEGPQPEIVRTRTGMAIVLDISNNGRQQVRKSTK